jgi:hypothetical protein
VSIEEVPMHLEILTFFQTKRMGWLMFPQGLVVKTRLHKLGVTNVACTLFGMDES